MKLITKRIAAIGMPLAVVAVSGVAFAAWTANGTGSGAAKATHEVVTVSTATAPAGDLFPNGDPGALVVKVTNPNSGDIAVTAIVVDPATPTSKGAGCSTGNPDLSLNSATISTYLGGLSVADRTVTSGGGTLTLTIPGGISMGGSADNSCQDQALTYPVQVTAVTP